MIELSLFSVTGNLTGLIVGAIAFISILIGRYVTIVGEYYFTKKLWIGFLIFGILAVVGSLFIGSIILSATASIFGFVFLWGIQEIIEQEERVAKGWFPKNPKRKKN